LGETRKVIGLEVLCPSAGTPKKMSRENRRLDRRKQPEARPETNGESQGAR